MKTKRKGLSYTASDIKVLKGLEGVRARPAMYIGSTDWRGLHHLVNEVVDNSIDEAVAGYCKNIWVTINEDGSCTVEDDGRGIPVDKVPEVNKSGVEVVMTTLHAGAKFHKKTYKVSGGLHGVGVSVVNALSEWLEVEVKRGGWLWYQRYERGVPVTPLKKKKRIPADETGTKVTFKPDSQIFKSTDLNPDIIAARLNELAFLNPQVTIHFEDKRSGRKEVFHYERGLLDFLENLRKGREMLYDPIQLHLERGSAIIDLVMVHVDDEGEQIYSYVNNINTIDGGTHVTGFKAGLTKVVNRYLREKVRDKEVTSLSGEDIRGGLIAILSLKIPEPQFEGQTKSKLANPEIRTLMESLIEMELEKIFNQKPEVINAILQRAITSYKARVAAQRAKELVKRKSKVDKLSTIAGKLAECISKNPEERELFIVEGDSAGGSAKLGRDRRIQAVLPLRGKIINVEKASFERIVNNEEIKTIIAALGCGINYDSTKLNLSKLRYNKVIIATDADVDGYHIRTLLLTFFYRYMRELIEEGHIYIAQPPLYKVRVKGKDIYVYTDKELEKLLRKYPNASVQRFKGLGEMNPEQLWETTMNPKTRKLKKVTLEDAEEAERILEMLMGTDVESRRKFIQENAKNVNEEDLDF